MKDSLNVSEKESLHGICLALLPILSGLQGLAQALHTAGVVTAGFWLTAVFLKAAPNLFPRKLRQTALILWIAYLTQAAWYLGWNTVWAAASLILLLPAELFWKRIPRSLSMRDFFWKGLGFWAFAVGLGICAEILGDRLLFFSFDRHPAGFFLLLGIAAFIGQNGVKQKA